MNVRGEGEFRRKRLKSWPLITLVVIAAACACSGCIWLAVPSLAYMGYKYEKTGTIPGMPSSTASPSSASQSGTTNNSPNNSSSDDHSIE